jgi:hypothetical protein
MTVAELIAATLDRLKLHYPQVSEADLERFKAMRKLLEKEPD